MRRSGPRSSRSARASSRARPGKSARTRPGRRRTRRCRRRRYESPYRSKARHTIEIVGDRDLAAESVPATLDVDLVDLIVARLEEDRNVQARFVHEFRYGDFVSEVG